MPANVTTTTEIDTILATIRANEGQKRTLKLALEKAVRVAVEAERKAIKGICDDLFNRENSAPYECRVTGRQMAKDIGEAIESRGTK